ncbi:MAG: PKD domain-containing protein, partial [Bacteroidales bacterium]
MKSSVYESKFLRSVLLAAGIIISGVFGKASAQCPLDVSFSYQQSCDSLYQGLFDNQTDTLPGGMVDFYEWDFGDGQVSNAVNPVHNYASSGFYIVSLTAYDTSGCSDDFSWPVIIGEPPQASFSFSSDSSCSSSPVEFNANTSVGNDLEFEWDFGDGNNYSSSSPTTSHVYNAFNNPSCDPYQEYTVTLIVTDMHGCADTAVETVYVKRRPQPILYDVSGYDFSNCHNDPDPSHPNDTVVVQDLTPNPACIDSMTINWGDGNITSGLQSGDFPYTHIYTQLGIFNLVYTVYGSNGCNGTTTYTVANQANPNVGLSALGQNTGCAPFLMRFVLEGYENNSTGTYYVWDFGDGTTITWNYNQPFINDTIEHLYTQSHCEFGLSFFTVSVTAYNECNPATMQYPSLTVYYPPEAAFECDTIACVGMPVQFTNYSMNGYGGNCDSTTNYLWDFGDGNFSGEVEPQHTYTSPGTYTVQLTASNAKCGSTDSVRTITITGVHPDFDFTVPCLGDSTYFTDLSYGYDSAWNIPSPASPVVQWHWDFGDGDTSNFQNPAHLYTGPGVYTVSLTATNIHGCDSTITRQVTVDELVVDSVNYGNVSCYGYDDGWITVYATAQITPITYTLLPDNISDTTGTFTGLEPGTYVVVLDDTVCTAVTDSITITEPDPITVDSLLVEQPLCHDDLGAATVFASGGTSLLYTLYPNGLQNTSGIFDSLATGTYYIAVTDTSGCPGDSTGPFTIVVPDEIVIDSIIKQDITCFGNDDGIIEVFASGGNDTLPYGFDLIRTGSVVASNTTGVFSGLSAGWYHAIVEDANGCSVTSDSVEIIDPPGIMADSLNVLDITCHGADDGYIYLRAIGGTGLLTYILYPDSVVNVTGEFSGLSAGTYHIIVEDENGCTLNVTGLTIQEPAPIVIDSVDHANITCHNFDDGWIQAYASGGSGLVYTLNPDNIQNSTGLFTGLDEGVYTISVSDSNNCPSVVTGDIEIFNPPLFQVDSITAQDLSCPGSTDGIVQAWASGGIDTLDYGYVLNPGTDSLANHSGLFTGLPEGGYVVRVTDANGCSVWSDSVQVNSPYQLEIDTLIVEDITCHNANNGIIELYMIGGTGTLTYTLFPDSIVQPNGIYHNLEEGTYYIEVLDINGCIFTVPNLVINNPDPILIDSIGYGHISCHNFDDGWFQVHASGGTGLSYTLHPDNVQNNSGLFAGLDAGQYWVTINDTNNCPPVVSDTVEILNPGLLRVDSVLVENLSCPGSDDGSIEVFASGGIDTLDYDYILNPGTDSLFNQSGWFAGLVPGGYIVRVVDNNGCEAYTDSLEILSPPPLVPDSVHTYDITCHNFDDGIIEVFMSGGTGTLTYTLLPDSAQNASGVFTSLSANTYQVVAEDENGCTYTVPNLVITNPPAIVLDSVNVQHITCHNYNDGWIQAFAHGGVNLNYTLLPDNVTNSSGLFTNLPAGYYQVTVSDENACPDVLSDTIHIIDPALLQIDSLDVQQITCHDDDDGSIQVYASGGIDTVAYQYVLNPSSDSIVNYTGYFGNLDEGIYEILVVDANNCSVLSNSVQIINPPALALNFLTIEDVTCFNANDGYIVAQVTGGTGQLTYTLYPDSVSNTTGVFNDLDGGDYWIRIVDGHGCIFEINDLEILEPGPIAIDSLAHQNITCHNDNDGWIQAYTSGGNTLTYTLYPDNLSNSSGLFAGLDAGEYFIYVSDDNGCPPATSDTITIINPDPLQIDSLYVQHLSCPGANDGIIEAYASGGIDSVAYTYVLNPGTNNISNNTGIFTGLEPDNYVVEVIDVNGCSVTTGTIAIHSPYQLEADSLVVQDITCHNFNDGLIGVYMTGGTGTLTYTLLPDSISDTTGIFNDLAADTYTVIVEDANGCSISIPGLVINNPDEISIDSTEIQHISCHNVNDGSIQVFASGGTGLIYNLIADSVNGTAQTNTTGIFNNLDGGDYYAVVGDSNYCPPDTLGPITINNPPELIIDSLNYTDVSCHGYNDGSVTVVASGGTVPYSYALMPDSTVNTTGLFYNLPGGVYTVRVTDANGCVTTSAAITLTDPDAITFDTVHTDISCNGADDGTITILNATGGTGSYEYSIDNGWTWSTLNYFNGLTPGNYFVMVRDANLCESASVLIEVQEPDLLEITGFDVTTPTCFGCSDGEAYAYVAGGTPPYYHNWSNGMSSNPITGIPAGTYTDTVTDANGCTTFASVLISQPDSLWVSLTAQHVACFGDSTGWAAATVTGGSTPYSYSWTRIPDLSVISTNDTIYEQPAGMYEVTVTDDYGNTVTESIEILQPAAPLSVSFTHPDTVCYGASNGWATAEVGGGTQPYYYEWSSGTGVYTDSIYNLPAGTYSLTVTDDNGCILTDSIVIHENPLLLVDATADPATICGNGNSQLTATPSGGTPPYDYLWSPDDSLNNPAVFNPVASPDQSTNYTVVVTDQRGCTAMSMVALNVLPTPSAAFTYQNPCASNLVYFTNQSSANGGTGTTYFWDFGDGNYSSQENPTHYYEQEDSTYTVTLVVTNASSCSDTAIQDVYVNPFLGLDIVSDTACYGDSTAFSYTVSNPAAVIDSCYWDFGDGSTSALNSPNHMYALPGTYNVYLTVYDHSGCIEVANKVVNVHPSPIAGFSDSTSCINNQTYFTDLSSGSGSSITSWHWDFDDGNTSALQDPVHEYLSAGTYDVTLIVTNENGCQGEITHSVVVFNRPVAGFTYDTSCVNGTVHFTDVSYTHTGTINSWYWDFGDGQTAVLQNPDHIYTAAGIYPVTLVIGNTLGCYDTVTHDVPVNPAPEASFTVAAVCANQPTQFTDQSVPNADSIVSWYWDFDDGYTSNLQNPIHIFPGPGSYDVELQVTNSNGCTHDTVVTMMVDSLPSVDFAYSPATCQNDSTFFYDLSDPNADSITDWFWKFGDGSISNEQNPFHIYAMSGTYDVTLTVTNSNGCTDSITRALMIEPQPVADFTYDTTCVGQTTHFYDQSIAQTGQIISWYWEFDDPASGPLNSSTVQNPTHTFAQGGSYDVMLVVTNNMYCRDTVVKTLVITDPPIAEFSVGNSCMNDTTLFFDESVATAAPISAWIWDFGDGTTETYTTPTDTVGHLYTQSGQYHVTLTVVDSNGCSDSKTRMITAYPLPTALFEVYENCVNNVTHFTDYSNGAGANVVSWFWDFG